MSPVPGFSVLQLAFHTALGCRAKTVSRGHGLNPCLCQCLVAIAGGALACRQDEGVDGGAQRGLTNATGVER